MLTQDNSTQAATSELIMCQEKRLKNFSFSEWLYYSSEEQNDKEPEALGTFFVRLMQM